ncbi:MAG: 1-acyl-sn-glycerol-3-phosphate acyltransferase [Bacilli bacterium]|nr:1-acyl-sn-glycerol-3-phosphate acyltransferase [Bacilli bacterium]
MKTINIFYAVDDNYINLLKVAMSSMIDNASPNYKYHVYVLHTSLSMASKKILKQGVKRKNLQISFFNVQAQMELLSKKLNVRDYYTLTTYYRLILPNTFVFINKAIYLDSDIVVKGDISKLYEYHLGENLVGAVKDGSVQIFDEFITYVEKALDIPHEHYFNAGILLMNLKKMREFHFEKKVTELVKKVSFKVAQDQDLLNVICKDRVLYLPESWNKMPLGEKIPEPNIIHYNLILKPWKQDDIMYEDVFWALAGKYGVSDILLDFKSKIPEERRIQEREGIENVKALCLYEAKRKRYYKEGIKFLSEEEKTERQIILERIQEFEKAGTFDKDVENDPPFTPLQPGDVDYLRKRFINKIRTRVTIRKSNKFFNNLIKQGQIVIDGYENVEILKGLKTGAVLTANHFNPFDSIPIHKAVAKYAPKKKLFKVIREGNWTFPGLYGQFMRNCNSLPLASNTLVLRQMIRATDTILKRGDLVLIYAEQSMWWNYRKPKPLKPGAFRFAATANVPVIPTFITMRDTDKKDQDGYPIQAYTLHILEPIYPDPSLSVAENVKNMKAANELAWKNIYEKVYGIPLEYTTVKK